MLTLRNCSFVNPDSSAAVDVGAVANSMAMNPPFSVRQMIGRRDRVRVRRLAVCLSTFAGAPAPVNMNPGWMDRAFADLAGIASFVRQMSGGRQYVEWEVFGPVQLMSIQRKQELDKIVSDTGDFGPLITGLRTAATNQAVPVDQFDRVIFVFDDGASSGATAPSDILVGASAFTPNLLEHELIHKFGVCSHADLTSQDDYGNLYCIMGDQSAYGFQINLGSGGPNAWVRTGPGLTAPYLQVAGWLDAKNISRFPHTAMDKRVNLVPNRGAPVTDDGAIIAAAIGDTPKRPSDPSQIWFEFRIATNFDREIMQGVIGGGGASSPGVLVAHEVTAKNTRCINRPWSKRIGALPADHGKQIGPVSGVTATIINATQSFISLRLQVT